MSNQPKPESPQVEPVQSPPTAEHGPDYAQIAKFVREFTKESDRACVILCAAKVDYLCAQILQKFFLPNPSGQDELLDTERALGTFSARIHALHRLALIDAEFARALHLFRRLRNTFAHEVSGSTFDEGSHRDRISELVRPLTEYRDYESFRAAYAQGKSSIASSFYAGATILIVHLECLLHDVKPLSGATACSYRPPGWTLIPTEET